MGPSSQSVAAPPSTKKVAAQQYQAAIKYMPKLVKEDFKLQRQYGKKYLNEQQKLLPKHEKLQEKMLEIGADLTKQGAKNNLKLLDRFDDRYLNANVNEAKKMTDKQLDLYRKFGDRIAQTERRQMEALDPAAFAAREAAGQGALEEYKLGSALSADEEREWNNRLRARQTATGSDIVGAAGITKEVMEKGLIGAQRKQERYQNLKTFGDGLIMPSQRPQIATIQSGRAQVPTGLPQYQQFGGSGPGAGMGGGGAGGMQFFNSSMAPQMDPLGQYNARMAAQQANAKPNPWSTVGSQAAAGASFGTTISPGYGTAIGAAAGAGLGAIQAFA